MRDKFGFTLIELIVTITIMSILLSVGFLSYRTVLKNGRDVKRQADLKSIQSALEQYRADLGYYPREVNMNTVLGTGASLTSIVGTTSRTYLNILPIESQITTTPYLYQAFPSTPCTNESGLLCNTYCLYATLENTPDSAFTTQCNSFPSGYHLLVTPP